MSQLTAETIEIPSAVQCAHCGLPSPPPTGDEAAFCCEGCRGAYHLIREWGLEDYYALRDQLGGGPNERVSADSAFDAFDDPLTLGESVPVADAGGLLRTRLAVQGLHCGACAWLIERAAAQQPGWHSARVRLSDHTLEAVFDPAALRLSELARLVSRLGYQVTPLIESARRQRDEAENRQHLIRIAAAGFCAANAMWIAVALYAGQFSGMSAEHRNLLHWVGVGLGLIAVTVPGRVFFRGAWGAIRTRTPHVDLPVALGIGVGAIAGVVAAVSGRGEAYFDSIAMLVFLLLVGRWIQFHQQRRATEAVTLLMRLTPRLATQIDGEGAVRRVLADSLQQHDVVRVDSGEVFPVDGVIEAGSTLIDRSLVTGESRPLEATAGDRIEAGSGNLQSTVDVRVEAVGRETRVGKLTALIEEAASQRAAIVRLADSIGGWFVVAVLVGAVGTVIHWWPLSRVAAVEHAVALLIVACPCALALATPLAIAIAIGRCAKRGILIRGADALERVHRAGTIWFDKTGTLTEGRLQVIEWGGDPESLALAAAAEQASRHAVAAAVVQAAERRGLVLEPAGDVRQIPGCGLEAVVRGKRVAVGNRRLMDEAAIASTPEQRERAGTIAADGGSPLWIAVDGKVVAIAALSDSLRPESRQVIEQLQQSGWRIGILSGDHPATVERIAKRLAIDPQRVHGGMTPEEKLARIGESKRAGETVVMVGDGVNDAAALAAADVGVAIRGGAAASLDAAPVYLAQGRLTQLVELVDACHRTVRTIRRNFVVSLSYNVFAVTLAASGWISPLIAAILMPISSLSVLSIVLTSRTFRRRAAS